MKPLLFIAAFLLGTSLRAADLPRGTPESQGVSSAGVLSFIEAADKSVDSLHGFILLRHGHKVAECYWAPYDAETPHMLYSLSKSFTSTAVGLAAAEGKLSIDDPVLKFFPADAPASPSTNLKAMRIIDLLRMSTGQQAEPARSLTAGDSWTKTFLAQPVPFKPGTHFLYNTSATYMCSAIVQKATGQSVLDYLKPRLFEPLAIDHPTWETSPQGISTGGYGLSIRTKDIASFGQLYLQKGEWQGKQLVPEAWVAKATAMQTSNGSNPASDWEQGYGYQFWRCRHGAYRGDGAFGQYCVVLPEQDAVIAITGGLKDMQAVMNLIWDKLLPAMRPTPLPADAAANANLEKVMKALSLKLPATAGTAAKGSDRKFAFPAGGDKLEALSVMGDKGGDTTIVAMFDGKEQRIVCGRDAWRKQEAAWGSYPKQPLAACGAWTADDAFTAKICFRETPYVITLNLKYTGDELQLKSQANVGFGANKETLGVGKATSP